MAEDIKIAKEHLITILTEGFKTKQETGNALNKDIYTFWKGIQKNLPAELLTLIENEPMSDATKQGLDTEFNRLLQKQNVKMNVVMFLFNQGVEL
jgi:site-specific DNA-adenine methylase